MIRNTFLIEGIVGRMDSAFNKAIEKNDREIFQALLGHCLRVIYEAYRLKKIGVFFDHVKLIYEVYDKFHSHSRFNTSLKPYEKFYFDYLSTSITGVISALATSMDLDIYGGRPIRDDNGMYFQHLFWSYNRIMFLAIAYQDAEAFTTFTRQLNKINVPDDYAFQSQLMALEFKEPQDIEEIGKVKAEIRKINEPATQLRHVKLSSIYLIYYLFSIEKISVEKLLQFTKRAQSPSVPADTILSDVTFFYGREASIGYLGWAQILNLLDSMDEDNPHDGFGVGPHEWLVFGFVIDILKEDKIVIPLSNFNGYANDSAIELLAKDIKSYVNSVLVNYQKWQPVFNGLSLEIIKTRAIVLVDAFASLRKLKLSQKTKEIALAPLDQNKVREFIKEVGKVWENNSLSEHLFSLFKNKKQDSQLDVKPVGFKGRLIDAKRMFLENHDPVFSSGHWGGDLARRQTSYLLGFILQLPEPNKIFDPIQGMKTGIEKIGERGFKASVIFVGSDYAITEKIARDKDFKPHWEEKSILYRNSYIGKYAGVSVYAIREQFLNGKVIVLDFEKALMLYQKTNAEWLKGVLKVELQPITTEEAVNILKNEPQNWKTDSEGNELDKDSSIYWIQNTVICNVCVFEKLAIAERHAIFVGVEDLQ